MATFRGSFGPATAAMVGAAERHLGVELPGDYRRFLRTTNGGCPEPDIFMVPGHGLVMLGVLYGVGPERVSLDLEYEYGEATQWNPLPPGFVPVGADPGGNQFLLATIGVEAGKVFFWDRVGFWVGEDGRNLFPVAESFAAFLDSLHESPPEDGTGVAADGGGV